MMTKLPKISIIGTGRVGSAIAFSLLIKGLAKEMVLVDYNPDVAAGDALDLMHATCFASPIDIHGGDYADTKDSDIVIISSSIPSKDIKSRLDLCQGNTELFKQTIPKIANASPNAILIIISNPLDIMTYVALKISGFSASKVIGIGTMIDSGRFRSLIAHEAQINPEEIHAYILGEHGDSQFPVLSYADVGGVPFRPKSTETKKIFEQARLGGYTVMNKKGFTNYSIALATATLVDCIVYDRHKIYPVSTLINGYCEVDDVCISVPTIIGSEGILKIVELNDMTTSEQRAFHDSAKILKELIGSLKL
jgi:L-lactate dehydrogenase